MGREVAIQVTYRKLVPVRRLPTAVCEQQRQSCQTQAAHQRINLHRIILSSVALRMTGRPQASRALLHIRGRPRQAGSTHCPGSRATRRKISCPSRSEHLCPEWGRCTRSVDHALRARRIDCWEFHLTCCKARSGCFMLCRFSRCCLRASLRPSSGILRLRCPEHEELRRRQSCRRS